MNWKPILYKANDEKAISTLHLDMTQKKKKLAFFKKNRATIAFQNTSKKSKNVRNKELLILERTRSAPKRPNRDSLVLKPTNHTNIYQISSVHSTSTEMPKGCKKPHSHNSTQGKRRV
ncbi:unnamed protein product [Moneuplotes crassus]|uniref:Uncharacterized protein n=1 Tax=Euplotes crassus TaxID=5936 RepID=A0AAD2DCA3_EUPCR|nr:unnamed protein product [Moneuplotes crassus]